MNLSILKENLKQGLFVTGHVAGKNINLPILSNIRIDIKKEGVKLIATNLEIGTIHTMRGKVEEECSFTVNAKIFSDYINLLPNKKIDLSLSENDLKIECENYKTKIKTESVEDYPLIPEVEKKSKIEIKGDEFRKALQKVIFSVASTESRIELSGVFFTFNKNKLIMASTDSYRLAEKEIEIKNENNEEEQKVIVPAKTLQEVSRILSNLPEGENNLEIYINDNQILFKIDGTELVSRLIEGQYPDYKQIIPTTSKTTTVVSRQELIRAIKTSALFSKTGINDINFDFPEGKNQLIVSSASGTAGENIVNIDTEVKGEDNGIIINYQYLLDGLNTIDDEKIKIEVMDNNTPCMIKPINEKGYLYIIMPIKQ